VIRVGCLAILVACRATTAPERVEVYDDSVAVVSTSPVEAIPAHWGDFVTARVHADDVRTTHIAASLAGVVSHVWVERGQHVARGDELFTIARDETESTGGYTVQSPVDGIVTELRIEVYAHVSPRSPLAAIADLSEVTVVADVPEADVAALKVGASAQVDVDSETFDATIEFVSAIADSATVAVRARIDNRTGKLRPNADVRLRWMVNDPTMVAVPITAVVDDGTASFVYVRARGALAKKPVKLGWFAGRRVATGGTLHAGDQVVTMGASAFEAEVNR
jgi:multidrug efflux pump subunit AcrA (membrane-fusion protein)